MTKKTRVTVRTAHGSALNDVLPPQTFESDGETPLVDSSDEEELSELDVQHLLEQADAEAAMEPVAAAVPDSLPICPTCHGTGHAEVPPVVATAPLGAPHALDAAPENSKIVVVLIEGKSHAVIAGPDGAKELPKDDVAHRLPEGARIHKLTDGRGFKSTQMSAVEDYPDLMTQTAGEAIARFIDHFHPHGLS